MIGRALSHYEVTDKLGEGGMGVVYLARDTKLGREVALKILPDQFARDSERLARFHREARTLAALNHPNIAAIYGLESDQDVHFLVMELARGEDLSQRIARGPIPPDEAARLACEIALGLEEAHQAGIIHRDLKPANVKVSEDGRVKVLDFGLARAFQGESAAEEETLDSPTITAAMTGAGVILGTAAYMSPEQARGTAVDRRSDIWSFGVLLFEMLTGRRVFQGETVSDTLAGILKSDPPWDDLPADTPDTVRLLLARCLDRDRQQRLQDIGEARILLSGGRISSLYTNLSLMPGTPGGEIPAASVGRRRPLIYAALGLVLGVAAGAAGLRALTPPPPEPPSRRFDVALPPTSENAATEPVVSPDGIMAVYVRDDRLWLRRFDTGATLELPGTDGGNMPFWSPDSRQVGYFEGTRVMRIAVAGGEPVMVCDLPAGESGVGGTWDENDRIIFTRRDETGLQQVPSRGGVPMSYMLPDTTRVMDVHEPYVLSGGMGVLYVAHVKDANFSEIYHHRDGTETLVFDAGDDNVRNPVYCASGHVLFRRNGANAGIWAVPYDPDTRKAGGEPFLVVGEGLWPSVSRDRTLLCATGQGSQHWQLVRCDREGRILARFGEPQDVNSVFALDSREERVVLVVRDGDTRQLWMLDLVRGTQSRLTFDDRLYTTPSWTRDGKFVISAGGTRSGLGNYDLIRISAEGLVPPQVLVRGAFPRVTPGDAAVVFSRWDNQNNWDLMSLELPPSRGERDTLVIAATPQTIVGGTDRQFGGVVSPDGALVAYTSRETGRSEVYLRRYPQGDQKRQVSVDGGGWPQWNGVGDRLYYMSDLDLVEVAVESDPTVRLGAPRVLFTRERYEEQAGAVYFEVSGDGESFYMLYQADDSVHVRPLTLVENWNAAN